MLSESSVWIMPTTALSAVLALKCRTLWERRKGRHRFSIARGVEEVRVLDSLGGVTTTPMIMDLRPTRLTLTTEGKIVVSAVFG